MSLGCSVFGCQMQHVQACTRLACDFPRVMGKRVASAFLDVLSVVYMSIQEACGLAESLPVSLASTGEGILFRFFNVSSVVCMGLQRTYG